MQTNRELEIVEINVQVYQVGSEECRVYHVELTYTNKSGYWSRWFTTKKELEAFHNGLLAATAYALPNFEIPDAVTILDIPTLNEPTCAGCGSIMVLDPDPEAEGTYVCPNCGEKSGQS